MSEKPIVKITRRLVEDTRGEEPRSEPGPFAAAEAFCTAIGFIVLLFGSVLILAVIFGK